MKSAFDLLGDGKWDLMCHLLEVAAKGRNLSTKIDGAPAVVMWSEFPGLKGPGVSFKLIIQQTQKGTPGAYFTSNEEIDKFFTEKDMEPGAKEHRIASFKNALKLARTVKPGIMVWGDVFYGKGDELTEVDGNPACTPNTLEYVFTDPQWVAQIEKSNFGIFVHTKVSSSFSVSRISDASGLLDKSEAFVLDPNDIEPKMKNFNAPGIGPIRAHCMSIKELNDPKFQKNLRKAFKTKDFSVLGDQADNIANLCAEISKALNDITEQIKLGGFYTRHQGKPSGGEGFVVSDGSDAMKLLTDDFTDKNLAHMHKVHEQAKQLTEAINNLLKVMKK